MNSPFHRIVRGEHVLHHHTAKHVIQAHSDSFESLILLLLLRLEVSSCYRREPADATWNVPFFVAAAAAAAAELCRSMITTSRRRVCVCVCWEPSHDGDGDDRASTDDLRPSCPCATNSACAHAHASQRTNWVFLNS
jgi:hypothetical protein